jgi:hypothetical protein
MSDNYIRLIPTDPSYLPEPTAQQTAADLLRSFVPDADEVTAELTEDIHFIDPGANFESVSCPACRKNIGEWWIDAMDRIWQIRFADLTITLPCCGSATSLNDLHHEWPAGFARFVLEAKNPNVRDLAAEQLEALERALGCKLRRIWAHT